MIWLWVESNHQPRAYETLALIPFELHSQEHCRFLIFDWRVRQQPPTPKTLKSKINNQKCCGGLAGFEPATFCLEDRRSNSAELQARIRWQEAAAGGRTPGSCSCLLLLLAVGRGVRLTAPLRTPRSRTVTVLTG